MKEGISPKNCACNLFKIETNFINQHETNKKIKFFDPFRGFESIGASLRGRRAENARANILRQDFLADFDIDRLEFDEDEIDDEPYSDSDDEY